MLSYEIDVAKASLSSGPVEEVVEIPSMKTEGFEQWIQKISVLAKRAIDHCGKASEFGEFVDYLFRALPELLRGRLDVHRRGCHRTCASFSRRPKAAVPRP